MAHLPRILVASLLGIFVTSIIHAADTKYRLNTPLYPSAYTIQITPYLDTGDSRNFTFDGTVDITLSTQVNGLNQIKMHSSNHSFLAENVTLSSSTGQIKVSSIEFDDFYEFVYMNLTSELVANTTYHLHISYEGQILTEMKGFYRSSYVEHNVTKWLGATQMQPTSARSVFPCFDEPAYKATFIVIINRPESYQPSLANTQLQASIPTDNGRVRETFYPTPRMSTYLLAFLVSEFKSGNYSDNNSKKFGIWSRPDAADQAAWAMDVGERIINGLSNFTGIDYYSTNQHIKLDHVGLPDFSAGAMENWGLVNYREAYLMYDRNESSVIYKQEVATIIAHESAHLWFGDLVTCHWWSDIWLNEGFATYFENKIVEIVEPGLGLEDQVIARTTSRGFQVDEESTISAMTNNDVDSPMDISEHFGQVSYSKAASVIRMMQNWIGMDAFKHGLNSYLKDREFDVSRPEHLYENLQSGADFYRSLTSYPNHKVADVMETWVTTPGYPIVHVDVDFDTKNITITQERYFKNPANSSNATYSIPISYTTESIHDFQNTTPAFIFDERSHSFIDENLEDGWVIFNIQQTGYYRVNYNEQLWKHIGDGLKGANRANIHRLNEAQIVDDLFALAVADHVSYDTVFYVLDFLAEETEYAPWAAAISGFTTLRTRFSKSPETLASLDKYILRLMTKVVEAVGFEETFIENDFFKLHRMQILNFACKLGHEGCVKQAVELFDGLRDKMSQIPPNSRPFTYCTALQQGDAEDYQLLWNRYLTSNVVNEQIDILGALGCSGVKDNINHYLSQLLATNPSVRRQDVSAVVSSVLRNPKNLDTAFEFVANNYQEIEKRWSLPTAFSYVMGKFTQEDDLIKVESWLLKCTECSTMDKQSIRKGIDGVRRNFQWADQHMDDLKLSLSSRNSCQVTIPSLALVLVTAFSKLIM